MIPQRSDRISAWLRTFAVQGSWNYRTLVGGGIAYGMLPLLRRIHAGDPVRLREAVERHAESFNAHPYLCAMAVAALARLEHEGVDVDRMGRFRAALRGPLGTLGDRAVWAEWRPFSLLVAIVAYGLGLGAVASVAVFLLVYNIGHVYLRTWAFRRGWEAGFAVGDMLRSSWVDRVADRLWPANMALLGATCVFVSHLTLDSIGFPVGSAWELVAAGVASALVGFRWPRRGGRAAILLLLALALSWLAAAALKGP